MVCSWKNVSNTSLTVGVLPFGFNRLEITPFTKITDNSLSQISCTELKIENIVEVLSSNKASGDDDISHKMLKGVSKTVSKPLCILMNRSLGEGIFPDLWKLANVISIFKKGDKSQPSNCRPVALLSYIGKLQERIVFKNIFKFVLTIISRTSTNLILYLIILQCFS